MKEKITIIDVAKRAGVSKGTVDRVLHNRGEVSKKSAAKVRKAIEELEYEPNVYASLLSSSNTHVIAGLLPDVVEGEYWDKINRGFVQGCEQAAAFGIRSRAFYYNQYDAEAFRRACAELLESNPAGVVLPPLFVADTMALVEELRKRAIPYVYVDSKLEDDDYFAYYGMPMYKSGRLCAALLTERDTPEEVAVIRIRRDKNGQSDPTVGRRAGFTDFMGQNFPGAVLREIIVDPSDSDKIYAALDAFFSANPDVRHIVMFSSRVYLIGRYLSEHPAAGRRVIGFDNLEKNMEMLSEGTVDILISQRTENQSRYAVNALSDYLLMRKKPQGRDNYMHMDILTKYNMENY